MFDSSTVTMAMKPPQAWATLFLLVSALLRLTDGCFRTSVPEPVRKTTEAPSMDASGLRPSHKLDCLPEEIQRQGCLNGGTCFAIRMDASRQLACTCTQQFTGTRCHLLYIDPKLYEVRQENLRTANLVAGASVCVMLVFIITFAVWVYFRYWRRKQQEPCKLTSSLPSNKQPITAHTKGIAGSNGQTDTCEVEMDLNGRDVENCPTTETALLDSDMKESRL